MERREESKPKTEKRATENMLLRPSDWLVKTQCAACKTTIDEDQDRIVLAAVEFESWGDDSGRLNVSRGEQELVSYCMFCADSIDELRMPNPWRRVDPATLSKSAPEAECNLLKALKAESAEADRKIGKSLASGDVRDFNAKMPTMIDDDDVLAHADTGSVGLPQDPVELATARFKVGTGWPVADAGDIEAARRAKLREFLRSPNSRRMPPKMREAGKRWTEGESQKEIGRALGMDQSTASRLIQKALEQANRRI